MENTIKPELLIPAGDMECLRAGVQNGADAIYFGSNLFSARAYSKNFTKEELKEAIDYCHINNVKCHLTLNTLLFNSEFKDALALADYAYRCGIDALIVQDIGLAKTLINNYKDLEIHASTQMTVHNLEGVKEAESLGFKRVVLSREVSLDEINYIRKNTDVELEMFIHGALCISYSGQCLFSSMVGARSGNRGKCAQSCRLPYELFEKDKNEMKIKSIDKGFLLSTRDLYSLENLPQLINSGVNSFKIEGRMKSPDYVANITRIYRKYIDKYFENPEGFKVSEEDKKSLMQSFNRGSFSSGHQDTKPNRDLVYKEKSNNSGLFLGYISKVDKKGYITFKTNEILEIGDGIAVSSEEGKYRVSELLIGKNNIKTAKPNDNIIVGRVKGNIKPGDKVYKISSKKLSDELSLTYKENSFNKKIPICMNLTIKENRPIEIELFVDCKPIYDNIKVSYSSNIIPEKAKDNPISEERIITQFSKLGNTPYIMDSMNLNMDSNLYIPSISALNDIRRTAIELLENEVTSFEKREVDFDKVISSLDKEVNEEKEINKVDKKQISLLLEKIDTDLDYSKIEGIDNIYIPLRLFANKKNKDIIINLSKKFNLFLYMPTIMKPNYKNIFIHLIYNIIESTDVKGFVVSNIGEIDLLKEAIDKDVLKKYLIVGNYTLNVFNNYSENEYSKLDLDYITPSVELNKENLLDLINNKKTKYELIVYGRTILMHTQYCLLGKSNKCYPECEQKCISGKEFYIKDRLGFTFPVLPNNLQTVTSIYNSKITSIESHDFNVESLRINILNENIDEINRVINIVKSGDKLEGNNYTNGNLNREV